MTDARVVELIVLVLGICLGFTLGWIACAYVQRHIAAENEQLRGALRYIRGVTGAHGLAAAARYVDRVLGEERES